MPTVPTTLPIPIPQQGNSKTQHPGPFHFRSSALPHNWLLSPFPQRSLIYPALLHPDTEALPECQSAPSSCITSISSAPLLNSTMFPSVSVVTIISGSLRGRFADIPSTQQALFATSSSFFACSRSQVTPSSGRKRPEFLIS